MDADRDWQLAVQAQVQANRYVPLPPAVRDAVELDHPLDGPSVVWNYDSHSNYVVLSERPLSADNYVTVGRYKVYDAGADSESARVRPPDALDGVVASSFSESDRVMYLAYESMTDGEVASVYLLSTAQLLGLLPGSGEAAATADGGVDLREAVLETPGFLPSV